MKKALFLAIFLFVLAGCGQKVEEKVLEKKTENLPVEIKKEEISVVNEEVEDEEIKLKNEKVSENSSDKIKFYNKTMGLSFSYDPKEYFVNESENKVEIGFVKFVDESENKTIISLFKKEASVSIEEAITLKFLDSDIKKNKCLVKERDFGFLPNSKMKRYVISSRNRNEEWVSAVKNCGRTDVFVIYNPSFSKEKFLLVVPSMDHYGFLENIGME